MKPILALVLAAACVVAGCVDPNPPAALRELEPVDSGDPGLVEHESPPPAPRIKTGNSSLRVLGACEPHLGCGGFVTTGFGNFTVGSVSPQAARATWDARDERTRIMQIFISTSQNSTVASTTSTSPAHVDLPRLDPGEYLVGIWFHGPMAGALSQSVNWTVE